MQKKLNHIFKRKPKRAKEPESRMDEAIQGLPRITNETVAEHREEMLGSARKFIYPLAHSRRSIVIISSILLVLLIAGFFTYIFLALYKFQSSSAFTYRITQVLPFPVAKAGSDYVAYENYLFQLRHYIHYYETQQDVDFDNSDSGRDQLANFRKQALQQVIDAAYVKRLARENNVTVSGSEIDQAVNLLREQNRLGSSDQELSDVLKEFWGWTIADFRRELGSQLLAQKVVAKLDTEATKKAQDALNRVKAGQDFATVAREVSGDIASRPAGGEYPFVIERNNRDLSPQLVDQLFKLKAGQSSDIINTGYSLEIVKVLSSDGGKIRAAHISSPFKPIAEYLKPLEKESPTKRYITPN
jgi:parvulin-like peptidyl-prolyl isomerase